MKCQHCLVIAILAATVAFIASSAMVTTAMANPQAPSSIAVTALDEDSLASPPRRGNRLPRREETRRRRLEILGQL